MSRIYKIMIMSGKFIWVIADNMTQAKFRVGNLEKDIGLPAMERVAAFGDERPELVFYTKWLGTS